MQSVESKSLVSLVQDAIQVEQALLESGGELTPEIESMLAAVETAIPAKIDNYKNIIDRLTLSGEFFEDRAKAYQAAAQGCAVAVDRLKDNIKYAMNSQGLTSIQGNEFKFSLSKMPSKVVLKDNVPAEYMKQSIKFEPDMEKIREALAMGEELPFAEIREVHALRGSIRK